MFVTGRETSVDTGIMGLTDCCSSVLRPTGMSRIPQELIDRILDYLRGDSVALRSCSFVCKSWLKQSRHHLFGLLRIRDTQIFTSLKSRPVVTDRFQAFYNFITVTASPGLRYQVHTLYLLGNEERQGPESFMSSDALSTILDKLPRVRILELNRVHFTSNPSDQEVSSISKHKLEVLSIGRVNLEEQPPDGLFSVLGLFSNLGMLRISYLETPRQQPTSVDIRRLERLQVRRFSLKGHSTILPQPSRTMPYMLSVLLKSSSFEFLETIEIKCCTIDQIHAFGAAVNVARAHLKSVAVDISDVVKVSADFTSIVESLNLSKCPSLRHFRICVFPNEEDAASYLWHRATHYLSALLYNISPLVTTVTIVLQYHDVLVKNCSMIDWESIRHFNGGWGRFTGLESVTFALMPRCMEPAIHKEAEFHISSGLPDLARLGFLKFATTGFWEDRENIIASCQRRKYI